MPIFTKGKRIGSDPLYKEISEKLDRPSEFSEAAKERVKELRVDAKKLEVTFATEGWIDIIQPLIDSEANPGNIYALLKSKESQTAKDMKIGKSEGFHNLNMILKNIIATLSVPIESKKEEGK
jgi:tRNA(Ser,Leu) C12 N-acetylase TAN1